MKQDTKDIEVSPAGPGMTLEDLLREEARELIEKAVATWQSYLGTYETVKTLDGHQAVVRNGYLPERELLTPIGRVGVRIPKVRDRSRGKAKFNSALAPPYVRRSKSLSAALPWLYLKGISTGETPSALEVLVGDGGVLMVDGRWDGEDDRQTGRRQTAAGNGPSRTGGDGQVTRS